MPINPGNAIASGATRPTRVSQELFGAIDRLEDVVDSLARLLRLVEAIEANPSLQSAGSAALSATTRQDVRDFRNRIAHGDEDLVEGKAGKGLSTATLRVDETGIEIQRVRLEFADLETMITEIHDYLQRVIV